MNQALKPLKITALESTWEHICSVIRSNGASFFQSGEDIFYLRAEDLLGCSYTEAVEEIIKPLPLINHQQLAEVAGLAVDSIAGVVDEQGQIIGWIDTESLLQFHLQQERKKNEQLQEIEIELNAILSASYDVIYVSNGEGYTLRVSDACETIWGVKAEEMIGKHVYELEEQGIYKPSATRLALERQEQVSVIQHTIRGRRLLVLATPIRNAKGDIIRVVNASRDITEVSRLQQELEKAHSLIERYRAEIKNYHFLEQEQKQHQPIFRSKQMEALVERAKKVAAFDSTVLLLGESGVGKEVFARMIHHVSNRSKREFVSINCGAIPEHLLESELFGYEKGSFTGADSKGKKGLFEIAHSGTIFLDEIGDLPKTLQVKLLRVLQEQEITRVGGTEAIAIDVRVIAATNANLMEKIKKQEFREDLYYRLNVVPITIPALRERKEDIIPLAMHFLETFNQRYGTHKKLSTATMDKLLHYDWPGNVRELQNMMENVIVTSEQDVVDISDLSFFNKEQPRQLVEVHGLLPLKQAVEEVERQLIARALEIYNTTRAAADVLEVNQSTISRKITRYQ